MSDPAEGSPRPRLATVPARSEPPAEPSSRFRRPGGVRWRFVWLLVGSLALTLVALGVEVHRSGSLSRELAATEARAEAAEARLAVYDQYLRAVRDRAGAVRQAVDGLAGVLDADPTDGPPRE